MKTPLYVKIMGLIWLAPLLMSCANLELNNNNEKTSAAPRNDFMLSFPITSLMSTPRSNDKPLALATND